MILLGASSIDFSSLAKVVEASLVVGIGVTIVFSLVIWGSTRATDLGRHGQRTAAAVHGVIAATALLVTLAVIVYGISIMATK